MGQDGNTLFDEIARAAGEAWQRCYDGKTEITRKALSPLKSIYDKLSGLSFVEPRVAPIAELLESEGESSDEAEDGQEAIAPQDNVESSEQSAS